MSILTDWLKGVAFEKRKMGQCIDCGNTSTYISETKRTILCWACFKNRVRAERDEITPDVLAEMPEAEREAFQYILRTTD